MTQQVPHKNLMIYIQIALAVAWLLALTSTWQHPGAT